MKFSKEKKADIRNYILEKVARNDDSISRSVSENYGINQNTAHTYINELIDEGVIRKIKRGQYELIPAEYEYQFDRGKGDFDHDMNAYTNYILPHLSAVEKNVEQIWAYVFGEMTNNVMDHSEAKNVKIRVIQDYMKTRVLLIDDGVGIFRKIKEYFNFDSLDDAICELFKGKLTTDSSRHSGEGIFFSSRLMDEFLIISDGKVFASDRYDDAMISDLKNSSFKGTCVLMGLSNFSKKTPKEIFEDFTDADYSFTKTKIPVRNIFDGSPVSRSQAKRLAYRLEKFTEVVVDFQDVEWIGQGFAHQLFVVFVNANPAIKLIPINMNEDVTKMYKHVINTI